MKTLYFVRHAKSSWDTDSSSDLNRPLNYRGLAAAPVAGKLLKSKGILPEIIFSSPANRALTTAKLIAAEIGYAEDKIEIIEKFYEANVSDIFDAISNVPDAVNSIMVFGHNPAHTLIFEKLYGKRSNALNTCSIFAFEFDIKKWEDVLGAEPKFLFLEAQKRG